MECLKCGKDLKEYGILSWQTGTMYYDISLDEKGDEEYEEDEFATWGEESGFQCKNCGAELDISLEQIKNILAGKN